MNLVAKFIEFLVQRLFGALLSLVKIRLAVQYLQGVKKARQAFIMLLAAILCLSLMVIGFLVVHAALFMILPWSVTTKAIILLVLGAIYVAVPVIVIQVLMSERSWMKFTRADVLVEKATAGTNNHVGV